MMKPKASVVILLVLTCLFSLINTIPALAVPPLPSSFYGRVKVSDGNVPDGTRVRALIDGKVFAEGHTQTYDGDSVYSLDVPGDDPSTAVRDGGREGDTIQFEIGGGLADQTAVWQSGTNVEVDLSTSAAGAGAAPQATPSPVPTQTPILRTQPSPAPTTLPQPSPTPVLTKNSEGDTSNNAGLTVVLVVAVALAAGGAAWAVRQRR